MSPKSMHTPFHLEVDPVHPHQLVRNAEKTHLIRLASVNKQWPNYRDYADRLALCWNTHAALAEALRAITDGIERLGYETGCCCCGGDMDKHTVGDGHSPVDQGAYFMEPLIAQARAALLALEPQPEQ